MLKPYEIDPWLESDDQDELQELVNTFPNELLDAYPISKRVSDPGNDSPDIIEPVDFGEQLSLGEFG